MNALAYARTEREQLHAAYARIAELEEELAAYQANDRHEAALDAREGRSHELRRLLGGATMRVTRLLIGMAAKPGHAFNKAAIIRLMDCDQDADPKGADVVICAARRGLRIAKAPGAIETIFGHGWRMDQALADFINAATAPAEGGR